MSIISHCENGNWVLLSSGVIDYELSKLSDSNRFEQVYRLYSAASERVQLTEQVEKRAAYLMQVGLRPFDSIHLAIAEINEADVFLTTDSRLIRTAKKLIYELKFKTLYRG